MISRGSISEMARYEETDPLGKSAHDKGAKLDAGKNRLSLVLSGFKDALWAVGEVGTFGANKYTPDGWKTVPQWEERYEDAELRHIFKRWMGENVDPDSNLLHAAHEAWNSLAKLQKLIEESRGKNDA